MVSGDTICAISSAVGSAAARIIVRTSGPLAIPILQSIARDGTRPSTGARRMGLAFAGLECSAWVYCFMAPHSYTGEDLTEFHLPGNALLARMLIDDLIRRGARPAEAGEYTARAYVNGRLSLVQAEGVAAIIGALNQRQLRAARQLVAGELARRLTPIMDLLAQTLAWVEAGIDFAQDDVTFIRAEELRGLIVQIDADL
jgi:tRNA modification GTPase